MEAFLAKMFPKLKQKKKIPDYRFQQAPMSDNTWVEITSGKYSGIVFSYGTVRFEHEIGYPKLSFEYNVLHSGEHDLHGLIRDDEFVTIIGDILTDIIIKDGQNRTNNPQELDL